MAFAPKLDGRVGFPPLQTISSVLGYFFGRWGKGNIVMGNYVGVTGDFIAEQCNHLIKWGTLVLFLFIGVVYLIFVHRVHIRTPKVNLSLPDIKTILPAAKEKPQETVEEKAPDTPEEKSAPATAVTPPPATPVEDNKITFSIDDEFSRVNQRAQARAEAEQKDTPADPQPAQQPAFTIAETMPEKPAANSEEPAQYSEFENVHTSHHYTIDELYDPHLDLKQYQMPTTDLLTDWEVRNVKVSSLRPCETTT